MDFNWLALAIAFVVGMGVAMVWYLNRFIDNVWRRGAGISPEQSKKASMRNMVQLVAANAVTAVGLAVGIGVTSDAFGNDSVWLALVVGFTVWLTFSASTLLQHNAFELKPPKLTLVNTAYQFALFLSMSLVIGLF